MPTWVYDDEYDWLAWVRCKIFIHTPRVYWSDQPEGKMFYWQCLHCKKIHHGGFVDKYYIDEKNYGEEDRLISVKEIKKRLKTI